MNSLFQGDGQIHYYQWLGTNMREVLTSAVSHPQKLLATMSSASRLYYALGIFLPLAFLPLFAPSSLFMTLPTWGYLMAREPFLFNMHEHHPCDLIPFLFTAFVFGYQRLLTWTQPDRGGFWVGKSRFITLCIVAFALGSYGSPETAVIHRYLYRRADFSPLRQFVRRIPRESSVAANWDNYLPVIADRHYAFKWQDVDKFERPVDVVLINANLPTSPDQTKKILQQGYRLVFQHGPHSAYAVSSPIPMDRLLRDLGWPPRRYRKGLLP